MLKKIPGCLSLLPISAIKIVDPSHFSYPKMRAYVFEKVDWLARTILIGVRQLNEGSKKIIRWMMIGKNTSISVISRISAKILSRGFLKYATGPAMSLAIAGCVRLTLGKRVPTSAPMYLSLGLALFSLCSYLGYRYFSDPDTQAKIKKKGLVPTIQDALPPIGKTKVKEPLLFGSLLSCFVVDAALQGIGCYASPPIVEDEAKQMLIRLKRLIDWINKKIKFPTATKETHQILKEECSYILSQTLQNLVILGDEELLLEYIKILESNEVINKIIPESERKALLLEWGYRTCVLNKKIALLPLFKDIKLLSADIQAFDAIVSGNGDLIEKLTNEHELDSQKLQMFCSELNDPASIFGLKTKQCNLIQVAIIQGNVDILRRIVASEESLDWTKKDDQGLGYLQLAALSGSKAIWDFIKEQGLAIPKKEAKEYLELLYCSLKGKDILIFNDLQNGLFDEDNLPIHKALIEDLFEKSLVFGADAVKSIILEKIPAIVQDMEEERLKSLLIASTLSGNKAVFDSAWISFIKKAKEPSMLFKAELLFTTLMAKTFNQDLLAFVLSLSPAINSLNFASSQGYNEELFVKNLESVSFKDQKAILKCFDIATLTTLLKKQGPLNGAFIRNPSLLKEACSRKIFNVQELYALAKQTIHLGNEESLEILMDQGIDVLRKLNLKEESLLYLAAVSLNIRIMETILKKCPKLSTATTAELKAIILELKCHSDDEVVVDEISRMLDTKSLGWGSQPSEDPMLKLVIHKVQSMGFKGYKLSDPSTDSAAISTKKGWGLFGY